MQAPTEPSSGAGRGEYLFSVSAAADRRGSTAGDRSAGFHRRDVPAGRQAIPERLAGAVALMPRGKAGCDVSPRVPTPGSATEGRSVEGLANGHGGIGIEGASSEVK